MKTKIKLELWDTQEKIFILMTCSSVYNGVSIIVVEDNGSELMFDPDRYTIVFLHLDQVTE